MAKPGYMVGEHLMDKGISCHPRCQSQHRRTTRYTEKVPMVFTNVPFWDKAEVAVSWSAMMVRLPWSGQVFTSDGADELAIIKTSHDDHDGWVSKVQVAPTEHVEQLLKDSSESFIAACSMIGFNEGTNSACLDVSPFINRDCGRQKRDSPGDIL